MIAMTPIGDAKKNIKEIREHFSKKYHVNEALKTEEHITLIHPFHTEPGILKDLILGLTKLYQYLMPIEITINGYGFFRQNKVVFLKPVINDKLNELHEITQEYIKDRFGIIKIRNIHTYTPHVTIGYRDLSTHDYNEAEKNLITKTEFIEWVQKEVSIWERINNKWETIDTIQLGVK